MFKSVEKPPSSDDVGECWPPFQGIKSWLWPKPCVTAFHDSQRFMISEWLTGISNRVHKCPAQDLQFLGQVGAYLPKMARIGESFGWSLQHFFLAPLLKLETADLHPNQWCLIEPCRARKPTWIRQNLIMSSVLSGVMRRRLWSHPWALPHMLHLW